jgi:hypothetical protein
MDESQGPADDVSLKTVLDAVNRQSKNIEAIVDMNFQHYKQNTHLLQIQFPAFVWVAGLLLTNGQLALQRLTDPQA